MPIVKMLSSAVAFTAITTETLETDKRTLDTEVLVHPKYLLKFTIYCIKY
jgi:hypothetical protein